MSTAIVKPATYPQWFARLAAYIYGARNWGVATPRNPPVKQSWGATLRGEPRK